MSNLLIIKCKNLMGMKCLMNLILNGMEKNSIIGQELQKKFVPKVESKENTDQFSKDETLIEEKSILT